MTRRTSPEAAIQVAVLKQITARGRRDAFVFAIPNGGLRSVSEAQRFKAQGVVAGVPDLCIIMDGRPHFLELKAEGGRVSATQLFVRRRLDEAGATTAIAYGLQEAVDWLEQWGVLPRATGA